MSKHKMLSQADLIITVYLNTDKIIILLNEDFLAIFQISQTVLKTSYCSKSMYVPVHYI
jgi:hypothetical protein